MRRRIQGIVCFGKRADANSPIFFFKEKNMSTRHRRSSRLESRETQGSQSRSRTRIMHFCSLGLGLSLV